MDIIFGIFSLVLLIVFVCYYEWGTAKKHKAILLPEFRIYWICFLLIVLMGIAGNLASHGLSALDLVTRIGIFEASLFGISGFLLINILLKLGNHVSEFSENILKVQKRILIKIPILGGVTFYTLASFVGFEWVLAGHILLNVVFVAGLIKIFKIKVFSIGNGIYLLLIIFSDLARIFIGASEELLVPIANLLLVVSLVFGLKMVNKTGFYDDKKNHAVGY